MNLRKVGLFVALAYGLSWALLFAYHGWGGRVDAPVYTLVLVGTMFAPALAAVIVQRLVYGASIRRLGLVLTASRGTGYFAAIILPIGLTLLATGLSGLLPGITFASGLSGVIAQLEAAGASPDQIAQTRVTLEGFGSWLPVVLIAAVVGGALLAGPTVNAIPALGEELGWRGLMLKELLPLGFWPSSILTGIVWGFWHAPAVWYGHNYPEHPTAGIFMMVGFTTLLSPLFAYLVLYTRSVLAAAVAHGTLNALPGMLLFLEGGSGLTRGLTGAAGLLVLLGGNAALYAFARRRGIPAFPSPAPSSSVA